MSEECSKWSKWIEDNNCTTDGETRQCLPNITFEGSMHFPEDGITLFHTPFHTKDDISIYDAVDKILHIGDTFGFKDGVAYPWGKELDAYKQIIKTYKQYDFDTILSGHSLPQGREAMAMMEAAEEPWQAYLKENNKTN